MPRKSKASSTAMKLCQPARSYLIIMVLMYLTTLAITYLDTSSVTDQLREQVYSTQGVAMYIIKVLVWVGILSILCRYKCLCLANIFVFFGALVYLGVLLYLIAILLGVDMTKVQEEAQRQADSQDETTPTTTTITTTTTTPEGFTL